MQALHRGKIERDVAEAAETVGAAKRGTAKAARDRFKGAKTEAAAGVAINGLTGGAGGAIGAGAKEVYKLRVTGELRYEAVPDGAAGYRSVDRQPRRIHATGMSAGGMITCDLALRRANYIASTSPKSGGLSPWNKVPQNAEPKNKSASMVFHGGTSDTWGSSLKYKVISEKFRDEIVQNGGFAFICDHGKGHTVPTDAVDSVWQFFKDHPWNTTPSPYAGGLPAGFPTYCKVP